MAKLNEDSVIEIWHRKTGTKWIQYTSLESALESESYENIEEANSREIEKQFQKEIENTVNNENKIKK